MNTQQPYRRRVDRAARELGTTSVPDGSTDVATRTEPPMPGTPGHSSSRSGQSRTVAWVRVSELHAVLGSRVAGRGIDLQSELARRARRAPSAVASRVSALGHPRPSATPGGSAPTSDRTEGRSL